MGTKVTIYNNESLQNISNELEELENQGKFNMPQDYSIKNALNSAWLKIVNTVDNKGIPVLQSCTMQSIHNALFDMVVQGLNPMKDQCYFIPYAGELTMMPSYFGKIAALKRVAEVESVDSMCVYADDIFEYDILDGIAVITKHKQAFGNQDGVLVGAYAIIKYADGRVHTVIMTMKEIEKSWSMSKAANSPARAKFPGEMAKRTVINRAIKITLKSSNDQDILSESIVRTNENEYREEEIIEQRIGLNFEDSTKDITEEVEEVETVIAEDASDE